MYNYPINIHEEAGSFWSSCPDIQEAHSAGDSVEELLANAVEGIKLALTIYVDQGRNIPPASEPKEGQQVIELPAQTVAKIALWNAMRANGMRVADLARKLNISHPVANRLIDFDHNSKIEQVESALKELGQSVRKATKSPSWIRLPHGGPEAGFYVNRLKDAYNEKGVRELVIGAVQKGLADVKPYSLDYLLRTRYARTPDTKQAVAGVINDLVDSGLFKRSTMEDPETHREVDSLALV